MKTCSRCKETLTVENFDKNAARNDGLSHYCKGCKRIAYSKWHHTKGQSQENKDRMKQNATRIVAEKLMDDPNYIIRNNLKRYGLTLENYEERLILQNGTCAICGDKPNGRGPSGQRLHVDHDHQTGEVRGLLCMACNHGLGKFRDSPDLLKAEIEYLESAPCHS